MHHVINRGSYDRPEILLRVCANNNHFVTIILVKGVLTNQSKVINLILILIICIAYMIIHYQRR